MFYSQFGQDKYLEENIFKGYKNGVFFDVGAHDGATFNNTLYFAKKHHWKGVNIEPIKSVYDKLVTNRPHAININCAVSNFDGTTDFICNTGYTEMLSGIKSNYDERHINRLQNELKQMGGTSEIINVKTKRIETICDENNITHIHFLSIDVEGAEFDVIKSINFDKLFIDVIVFEDNYKNKSDDIIEYLKLKNYKIIKNDTDIFMIHIKSIFLDTNKKIIDQSIYYFNNNYSFPININYFNDNHVEVYSSYWNNDYGIFDNNNNIILFNSLGKGLVKNDSIIFNENNIWRKDSRKNILFIGANDMYEIFNYLDKYNNGLFIEAIPDTFYKLQNNLNNTKNYNTNYIAINKLVASESGKLFKFNVFNNGGASSSIYEPNMQNWLWSDVKINNEIEILSTTIEEILKQYKWENIEYDVVLDVQGAELEVLKGFGFNNLNNIKELTVEISRKEFYKGGVLFDELNNFLINNNFNLINSPINDHCDVKYIHL
jgi:FkbM family methyltransferase